MLPRTQAMGPSWGHASWALVPGPHWVARTSLAAEFLRPRLFGIALQALKAFAAAEATNLETSSSGAS